MTRTWTIIGVRDVPGGFRWFQALLVTRDPALPTTILGKSSIQTALCCSVSTSGVPTGIPH